MAKYAELTFDEEMMSPSELLALYRVTSDDEARLKELGETVGDRLDAVIEDFYTWLSREPWFEEFFTDEAVLERVRHLQHEYWQDFLSRNGRKISRSTTRSR